MLSYPGSALRKFSMSLPESLWAVGGQLVVLLVLQGKVLNTGDGDDPARHNSNVFSIK